MDNKEKCCGNCVHYRFTEEYWHDHYLIRAHQYCEYRSGCNEYEVNYADDGCRYFKKKEQPAK